MIVTAPETIPTKTLNENATQTVTAKSKPDGGGEAELFWITWTADGKHWHVAILPNGKQATANTLERAEAMLEQCIVFLKLKSHSTPGADARIARAITKKLKINIAG